MIKWSKSNEFHPGTIQLLGKLKSLHNAFQMSVRNGGLHQLLFNWKRNFLHLTEMRMTLQQLTIPWGNHLSHTPVWPPSAQHEQPSSLLLCLHRRAVRTQLPVARYHRYVSRGLLEGTPMTILIASSCKASGFMQFLFIFCWTASFSALSRSHIYVFSDPSITRD